MSMLVNNIFDLNEASSSEKFQMQFPELASSVKRITEEKYGCYVYSKSKEAADKICDALRAKYIGFNKCSTEIKVFNKTVSIVTTPKITETIPIQQLKPKLDPLASKPSEVERPMSSDFKNLFTLSILKERLFSTGFSESQVYSIEVRTDMVTIWAGTEKQAENLKLHLRLFLDSNGLSHSDSKVHIYNHDKLLLFLYPELTFQTNQSQLQESCTLDAFKKQLALNGYKGSVTSLQLHSHVLTVETESCDQAEALVTLLRRVLQTDFVFSNAAVVHIRKLDNVAAFLSSTLTKSNLQSKPPQAILDDDVEMLDTETKIKRLNPNVVSFNEEKLTITLHSKQAALDFKNYLVELSLDKKPTVVLGNVLTIKSESLLQDIIRIVSE